jgi:hypothetical protein
LERRQSGNKTKGISVLVSGGHARLKPAPSIFVVSLMPSLLPMASPLVT